MSGKLRDIEELLGCEKGNRILIIGSGGTLKEEGQKVINLARSSDVVTIGINNMTGLMIPKYHLWTNFKRYKTFSSVIDPESVLLLGKKLYKRLKNLATDSICIDYIDRVKTPIVFRDNRIEGYFRTAGCLAIMIASLMKTSSIYIAGMDGYTLYSKSEIYSKKKNQHVYGSGFTDGTDWKTCRQKDKIVYQVLKDLREYGIEFSIITPTVFSDFYRDDVI